MKRINQEKTARGFFNITGSFGEVYGKVSADSNKIVAKSDKYCATLDVEEHEYGVLVQKGRFKNISAEKITVDNLMSRFVFHGGDWEVYTQYNCWQNESKGVWNELAATVCASVTGVRSCSGAAPFMALWNKQTNRGYAFHLLAHCAWEMRATKTYDNTTGEISYTVVDLGVNPRNFSAELESGEEIEIPEVICYTVKNRLDLDCYKIHNYYNKAYPRRFEMPVVYDTWLYKFDQITYDNVQCQIDKAAELGAEYFVIDAGWFGKGNVWWGYRGDWKENMSFGFRGKMKQVSDMVRAKGMKFGFWLEIESAGAEADILDEHPDYFIEYNGMYFLDFSNPDACRYITDTVVDLVKQFDAEFIKFDFNQDMLCDKDRKAFIDYHKGHIWVMKQIRKQCPKVYLENCASGGLRMDLSDACLFDSYWISDDHSPYEGMRIYKETLLRMPPQLMEKWAAIRSISNFEPVYMGTNDKILSSHDCSWNFAVEVTRNFLKGFMLGGPFGISADLNLLSDDAFNAVKETIAEIKRTRPFWKSAVCRIIADSYGVFAFEYSDKEFNEIKIHVFSQKMNQKSITVYPTLDLSKDYMIDGKVVSASEIEENGIEIAVDGDYGCTIVEFNAI